MISRDKNVKIKSTSPSKVADVEAQKCQIARIAPQHWRQVKDDIGIYPELDVLLVSSKGRGSGRRRWNQANSRNLDDMLELDLGRDTMIEIPYRLAINSSTLLENLEDIMGIKLFKYQNVLLRPFKALVAYNVEIRRALDEIKMSLDYGVDYDEDYDDLRVEINTPAQVKTRKRDELRCLVDFMDNDMRDIFRIQDNVIRQAIDEIAFEHLWLLYKPGDLLFSASSQDDDSSCQAYRVLHVTGGRHVIDSRSNTRFNAVTDRDWDSESEDDREARDTVRNTSLMTPFIIDCFFIDCNGQKYGPKSRRIVIPEYKGKRSIKSLDAFPAVFHPQYHAVRKALINRGQRFWELASGKHQYYAGPTLRESREIPNRPYYNYIIQDEEVRT